MKKLILLMMVVLLYSCGPHTYSTRYAGKEDVSFIIVLTDGAKYKDIDVDVDGRIYPVKKVQKVKDAKKATPIVVAPGKHTIKVKSYGRVLAEENIFIGLQETKQIILR